MYYFILSQLFKSHASNQCWSFLDIQDIHNLSRIKGEKNKNKAETEATEMRLFRLFMATKYKNKLLIKYLEHSLRILQGPIDLIEDLTIIYSRQTMT